MVRLVPFLLLTLAFATPPLRAQTTAGREREVLAAVETLLGVLKTKDTAAARVVVDSATRLTLLRPAPGGGARAVVLTGDQFLQAVARPGAPNAEELIRNPEVRMDGDLATVWAEYQVVVNGTVDHCGFDAFQLARRAQGWRILNVSDTYRKEGCGPPWTTGR